MQKGLASCRRGKERKEVFDDVVDTDGVCCKTFEKVYEERPLAKVRLAKVNAS